MTFTLLFVLVFISAAGVDWVEAYYVRAVAADRAQRAAACSIAMYGLGCVGFFAVIEVSWWLMIAEVLGLYCGTMVALRPREVLTGIQKVLTRGQ